MRSLERGLGPVTAVVHAAASGPVERCDRLSEPTLRSFLSGQGARFGNVIGAVAMERVRVLVTFGSVAARYGRAGGACDALASGLLAEQAARRAEAWPRCRVLHLDWAPWAEPDHGDRAESRPGTGPQPGGTAPIPVEDGSRLLLSLLTTADMPARAAVHGRLGMPVPQAVRPGLAAPAVRGRFGETVRVYYPGVELVADTRLSVRADPYLTDYRIDDLPMLPAAMVLEAMAQAASALAGRELRHLANVQLAGAGIAAGTDRSRGDGDPGLRPPRRQHRGNGASLRRDGLPAGPRPSRVRRGGTARGSTVSCGLGRWPGAGHGGRGPGGHGGRHRPVRAGVLPGRAVPPGGLPAGGQLARLPGAGPRQRRPALVRGGAGPVDAPRCWAARG